MDRSEVIYLIGHTKEQDANGVWRKTEHKRQVYVNVKSASASEFFEGGRNGLNPSFVFSLFSYDYHDETLVEYKGKRYSIYRTYILKKGSGDFIELHVERQGGAV